ncbi:hypothetical protein PHJA_002309400 [Phtheirospermum japonicum]|uniref:Myb/SANT-like domain-containing protein n=1 Tax=Phtheirospermum japonicum TaxID=374723 RepID=A0A830CZT3_9LAMI|nr:hypothetical protein PHJA_002309400 [Phtheirospermum japonicum]
MYQSIGWTKDEEDYLIRQLNYAADNVPVDESDFWDFSLSIIAEMLTEDFGKEFSTAKVKRQVQLYKDRFDAFVEWKKSPGIKYHVKTNRVKVNGTYWDNIGKETRMQRYFRTFGLEYYKEGYNLWKKNNAAPIDFSRVDGYSRFNPIFVELEDDDTDDDDDEADSEDELMDEEDIDDLAPTIHVVDDGEESVGSSGIDDM